MNCHGLYLLPLLAFAINAHAGNPKGVNAIPATRVAELNKSLAAPSEKFDTPARILKAYVPIYPISRYLSGKAGSCRMEMTIGPTGRAEDVKADPEADEKMCAHALHALRYWEFAPASKGGQYVRTRFRMPFHYQIRR